LPVSRFGRRNGRGEDRAARETLTQANCSSRFRLGVMTFLSSLGRPCDRTAPRPSSDHLRRMHLARGCATVDAQSEPASIRDNGGRHGEHRRLGAARRDPAQDGYGARWNAEQLREPYRQERVEARSALPFALPSDTGAALAALTASIEPPAARAARSSLGHGLSVQRIDGGNSQFVRRIHQSATSFDCCLRSADVR